VVRRVVIRSGRLDPVADRQGSDERDKRDQRAADSGHVGALFQIPGSRTGYRLSGGHDSIMGMSDSMTTSTITITGANGDDVQAYLARPEGTHSRGGVVVIHHMPGYDRGSKEIVRRFAELGYDAICPNLYWREAPGADPDDAAATARANGGVPDERLVGDVGGAAEYLRALATSNGKVGVIGYCSGGRQSVLAACNLDLDAAVDCYGAYVTGTPPEGWPVKVTNLVDQLPNLRAPLLGLFGNEDSYPTPAQVDELEQILKDNGKPHEFHRYDDAGHAFFSTDRPSYRVAAALDGWERVEAFYGTYLSA
jgi:carboxymethylenebutenolidase